MPIGPFAQESDDTARRIVDVNLHGVMLGTKLALERFIPRGRGHVVNVASAAGKVGFAGGATYCATKHGVVGLSEALRAELRGTGVEVSVVIPVVVRTELGSGLPETRLFKSVQPEDVAARIVEALRLRLFDVYVPRSLAAIVRMQALLPRRLNEAFVRLIKADQVLARPDPRARAAYEARVRAALTGPEATARPGERV